MTTYTAPLAEFEFILGLVAKDSSANPVELETLSPELREAILNECARLCENELHPLNIQGDIEGCSFEDGHVRTPDRFKEAWRLLRDGGWIGLSFPEEFGGQGLPGVLAEAVYEMLSSANMSFSGYSELTEAVFHSIHAHGTHSQQQTYLKPLGSGQWTGSMHLTEPQAGSDLAAIRTTATEQSDGTFLLNGTKVFITNAEHDLAENIVNLVLARSLSMNGEDLGIGLYIVPKFLPTTGGDPGKRNGVNCVGLEKKMGLKASPTGTIAYENATGFLLGQAGRGLQAMFTMVNDARLGVAIQGLAISEVAYQNASSYARERIQGRPVGTKEDRRIVNHPDVRRMLLRMRSFNEGARYLTLWTAAQLDIARHGVEEDVRRAAEARAGLLTPILKAYCTETGLESSILGMQCFGGYGYVHETGMEQFLRDVRVTSIYEGTNGIQAQDLVFRKIVGREAAAVDEMFTRFDASLAAAGELPALETVSKSLDTLSSRLRTATTRILEYISNDNVAAAVVAADYLRLFALTLMNWSWLEQTLEICRGATEFAEDYRSSKLWLANFFCGHVAPESAVCAERIELGDAGVSSISSEAI